MIGNAQGFNVLPHILSFRLVGWSLAVYLLSVNL